MTFTLTLLAIGAAVTLVLGIIGLYGVIAYVVSLRSREISIRIALGLLPAAATRMILRQGEAIIAVGAAVGLLVFLLFARLLTSLAFEVSPFDLRIAVVAEAWAVWEDVRSVNGPALVFENSKVARRLHEYPVNWRDLRDEQLRLELVKVMLFRRDSAHSPM